MIKKEGTALKLRADRADRGTETLKTTNLLKMVHSKNYLNRTFKKENKKVNKKGYFCGLNLTNLLISLVEI